MCIAITDDIALETDKYIAQCCIYLLLTFNGFTLINAVKAAMKRKPAYTGIMVIRTDHILQIAGAIFSYLL